MAEYEVDVLVHVNRREHDDPADAAAVLADLLSPLP